MKFNIMESKEEQGGHPPPADVFDDSVSGLSIPEEYLRAELVKATELTGFSKSVIQPKLFGCLFDGADNSGTTPSLERKGGVVAKMALNRAGSRSRRSQQRYARRLLVVRDALLQLVSTAKLAGPSPSFSRSLSTPSSFNRILSVSRRKALAFPHVMSRFYNTSKDIYSLPGWAKALFSSADQSYLGPINSVWSRLLNQSKRFGRGVSPSCKTLRPLTSALTLRPS